MYVRIMITNMIYVLPVKRSEEIALNVQEMRKNYEKNEFDVHY